MHRTSLPPIGRGRVDSSSRFRFFSLAFAGIHCAESLGASLPGQFTAYQPSNCCLSSLHEHDGMNSNRIFLILTRSISSAARIKFKVYGFKSAQASMKSRCSSCRSYQSAETNGNRVGIKKRANPVSQTCVCHGSSGSAFRSSRLTASSLTHPASKRPANPRRSAATS